ncbi:hypothetical protein DV515_00003909 [Chloebia gouldiae]|uniref:Uncharacterized protein n=1 Tax=Chloebia gouldiae TaxID=44316 RepID=A0A3L8SRZ9_CHLGU|nr:hypothetical protein DV515_00003909 [Chloebia gouldiae]
MTHIFTHTLAGHKTPTGLCFPAAAVENHLRTSGHRTELQHPLLSPTGDLLGWPGVMAVVPEEFSIPIPIRKSHTPDQAAHPAQVGPSSLVHICTQLFPLAKQQHRRRTKTKTKPKSLTHSNSPTLPSVATTFQARKPSISHPARCYAGSHRLGGRETSPCVSVLAPPWKSPVPP